MRWVATKINHRIRNNWFKRALDHVTRETVESNAAKHHDGEGIEQDDA